MTGGLVDLFYEEQAKYHEHMEYWCRSHVPRKTVYGAEAENARLMTVNALEHRESARYWREKADG